MVKKKVRKSTKRISKSPKSNKKKSNIMKKVYPLLAIVIIIAIIIGARTDKPEESTNDSNDVIIAFINDQPIYQSDLDKETAQLPQEMQLALDQNAILSQLIDKKLLIEEAKKAGTKVDADLETVLVTNNITMEQLEENIAAQGISMEEFKDQLRILRFLNETIFRSLSVSDATIDEFYITNPELFIKPETVSARHILISTSERTEEEARIIIDEVEATLEDDVGNFCDLVTQYSEDPGSRESCGEYPPFSRDSNFVQEYKDAAFANKINEWRVAKTQFGLHLIQTLEKIPSATIDLESVREQVRSNLYFELQKAVFSQYIETLRLEANVINCGESPELCSQEDSNMKTVTTTEVSMASSENPLDEFAKCLSDKGVKMYGAYWCTRCESQKKLFGDSFSKVDYVECSEENNPRSQLKICTDAGIEGYPTWEINDRKYSDVQTLENLAGLSGCTL